MLHCNSVSAAAGVYGVFVKLFGNEFQVDDFSHLLESVKLITEDVSSSSDIYSPLQAETSSFDRKSSPYYHTFKEIEISARKNSKIFSKPNIFFSKELFDYVADFLIPYFPLWSATGITQFHLNRDSNAPIENYFKILKHQILDGETHIPAPRFIMENFKIIEARLKQRQFPLKTTRCKERIREIISDDENDAVETWKKPKPMNRFLKYSKFIDKNMIEQCEEATTICDNGSREHFKKFTPEDDSMTETAASKILFHTKLMYPDGFPDLRKDINGYIIEAKNFRTLMPFQSAE